MSPVIASLMTSYSIVLAGLRLAKERHIRRQSEGFGLRWFDRMKP